MGLQVVIGLPTRHLGFGKSQIHWGHTLMSGDPKNQGPKKPQSEKFKETAREVGADEDEDTFMDKLKRIAKHKPKKEKSGK